MRAHAGSRITISGEIFCAPSGAHAHRKQADEFYVKLRPATLGKLLERIVVGLESISGHGREDTA